MRPIPALIDAAGLSSESGAPSSRISPAWGSAPNKRSADPLLTRPAESDEPDDFGPRDVEVDRPGPGDGEAADGEPRLFRPRARRGFELVERLADDQRNEFLRGGVRHPSFADQRSVAQDGDPVGDLEHFVETMRNVDHPDAASLQGPQRVEQPMHLVGRQRRRRLVENEDVGLDAERAGDRDERLFGARQIAHAHRRRERAVDLGERGPRRRLGRVPVDEAPSARIAGRERDILGDRHPFDETEILMDEGDRLMLAEAGRAMPVALAAVLDRSLGRLDDAAESLDQGRFAGPVLSEQGQNFPGMQIERTRRAKP